MTTGRATSTAPAASSAPPDVYWPWKFDSPSGAMRSDSSLITITRGMRNSFHVHMKTSSTMVKMAGRPIGSSTLHSVRQWPAPSSRAASTSSREVLRK